MQSVVRSPVVVGRAAELAEVRARIAAPGGLLVTGEAGIGKTRLLDEAAGAARATGLTVLAGRALPGGTAFRPLTEALLPHLDAPAELGAYRPALERLRSSAVAVPGGADQALVLAEGIRRLLAAVAPAGCLLRLEDLHWADPDTVAVVDYLAGAGGELRVAVSCRPGPVADRLVRAPGMVLVALHPLDVDGVAALAAACRGGVPLPPGEAAALHARSAGLPFVVEEMLAEPDAVPPTLAALVAGRLAALPAGGRRVLEAAAVLGAEPDWALVGGVADVAPEVVPATLRAAVAESLLVRDGAGLRWPHALTREAVLDALLPPERALLAARAATALGDDPRVADLLVEAGEPDRAAALHLGLARAAAARGALRAADEHLAAADAAGPGPGVATTLLLERVAVLTLTGRATTALDLGAVGLERTTGDEHAELCLRLARTAVAAGRWPAVVEYVERAGRPGDPRSAVLLADAAFGAGDPARAATLAGEAVRRADHDPATLCEALGVLARTLWRTDLAACATAFRRAAQVAAEHGLLPARITALHGAGMMEALDDDDCPTLHRARDLARDAGMLGQLAASDVIITDLVLMREGPVAAEVRARAALDVATRLRLTALTDIARVQTAACLAAAGDRVAAEALIAETTATTIGHVAMVAAARGIGALVAHDLAAAHAELGSRIGVVLDDRATPILPPVGAWVLLDTILGDGSARARVTTHPSGLSGSIRAALRYADAVTAGAAGRTAEATAALAEGDALLGARSWWRRLLRLPVLECAVRHGWGEPVARLRADLAAHEAAGAELQARTCRDLLRAAGAPTRGRHGTTVPPRLRAAGVTRRELEVLRLVAEGLTNAEVAERLVLSPRTVETHVANLLAKSGVSRRAELRSWSGQSP